MTPTDSAVSTTRRFGGMHVAFLVGALLSMSCAKESGSAAPAEERDTESKQATGSRDEVPSAAQTVTPVDLVIKDIDGKDLDLKSLRGKAVLVVNTASECGYTPQYAGLEKLHRAYKDKGLVVLAVPSNDFGEQEPGTNEDIKEFTAEKFEVTFPLMDKVHAAGDDISPLYKTLTESGPEATRGPVKWNFTKFLLDAEGKIVKRFESKTEPMSSDVTSAIERVLPKS